MKCKCKGLEPKWVPVCLGRCAGQEARSQGEERQERLSCEPCSVPRCAGATKGCEQASGMSETDYKGEVRGREAGRRLRRESRR